MATSLRMIRLPPGAWNHILSRAMFCAQGVAEEDVVGVESFLKTSSKDESGNSIEKIHTSVDFGDQCPNFLVAYANDAIFIAFRAIDIRTLKDYNIANGFPVNASSARGHLYQGAGF